MKKNSVKRSTVLNYNYNVIVITKLYTTLFTYLFDILLASYLLVLLVFLFLHLLIEYESLDVFIKYFKFLMQINRVAILF